MMTIAEIFAPLVRKILSVVADKVTDEFGASKAAADRIVSEIHAEVVQAIIQYRFMEMDLAVLVLDAQREIQKREEREAYERGKAMAPPPENIEIVKPEDG